jgi:hypothetical protein
MEPHFYNDDDFEELLKQKADQYKMYPSEKVWKEIHRTLHPRKKWYLFGFALLLSGLGLYTAHELAGSGSASKPLAQKTKAASSETPVTQPTQLIPFKPAAVTDDEIAEGTKSTRRTTADKKLQKSETVAEPAIVVPMYPVMEDAIVDDIMVSATSVDMINEEHESAVTPKTSITKNFIAAPLSGDLSAQSIAALKESEAAEEEKSTGINWLHESVVNLFSTPRSKRLSFQFSFAPTMNYRKLRGNPYAQIRSDIKNIPLALNIEGDIGRIVNHKPALGFELGSSVMYAVGKNISVKGGLQFNYSRYAIQAYRGSGEIATISLSNVSGYRTDSISAYTQLSNFGGYQTKEIQNQYFQLSAPIGIEWRLLGNKRLQLNVAGTLQPTYLLNRNTYLITTDYKNFTQEPSLVRRWNVNSSAEAYVSYSVGGVRWQVGPQFRYQLLSSYVNKYPVKEYLMEYGVKIGVTKTIR